MSFQIMPRSQNAHALVNAGFLYKIHSSNNTVQEARIVIGALSPSFIRASATEKYLEGKKLFTNETLQAALKIMEQELVVVANPPDPSVEYRKKAALGLFYKVRNIAQNNMYRLRTFTKNILFLMCLQTAYSSEYTTLGEPCYYTFTCHYRLHKLS